MKKYLREKFGPVFWFFFCGFLSLLYAPFVAERSYDIIDLIGFGFFGAIGTAIIEYYLSDKPKNK
jgi:mannose/fructose/N-acetylgalactosamine-specific phosphotransferase system component IIC